MDSAERTELEVYKHVNKIINSLRPYILGEGGDVELVDITDGVVTIRLSGACAGCSMINMTFDNGIRNWIMEEVPEIRDVILDQNSYIPEGY